MMRIRVIVFAVLLLIGTSYVFGADVELKKIKVSGNIFSEYSYRLMEKDADYNAFEITRAYINFGSNLTETIGFKLTTDIARYSTSNPQNLQIFLKLGYVEFKDTLLGKITVGLQPLPWTPYVEKVWKHRFIAKVFADAEGKQTTTDLGIDVSGNLTKELEYDFSFVNGEGFNSAEANKAKDGYARLSYEMLKGFKIGTHYRYGLTNIEQKRDRVNALLSLENSDWTLATEYIYTVDQSGQSKGQYFGSGYSVFGSYKFISSLTLVGRYDYFDPDINPDKMDNGHFRVIYGVAYDVSDSIRVSFDNQQVKYENKGGLPSENIVYVHSSLTF